MSALDCQYSDDGWIVRETGVAAAVLSVGGLTFHTGTRATVEMGVRRSGREYMTFICQAKLREGSWALDQCRCDHQRGAAAVCLVI